MDGRTGPLRRLGFSEYEARAYLALLDEHPATAYQVARRSGVPTSKVYEVLERLAGRGAVLAQPGDPVRYAPLPPGDLAERERAETIAALDALAATLPPAPPSGPQLAGVWTLPGGGPVRERARRLADEARFELLAVVPPARLPEELSAAFDRATARGLRVRLRSLPEGEERLLLLADGRDALLGPLTPLPGQSALYSRGDALAAFARDYFALLDRPERPSPARDWLTWEEEKERRLLTQ